LLREQVSIRDLPSILETLQDTATATKNQVLWVEAVRQTLARSVIPSLLGDDKKLTVVQVDLRSKNKSPRRSSLKAQALVPADLNRHFSAGSSNACGVLWESTSQPALLSCCAIARQGFISDGCWSPLCPAW
jgi:flagellar biosynthesis component FlhA